MEDEQDEPTTDLSDRVGGTGFSAEDRRKTLERLGLADTSVRAAAIEEQFGIAKSVHVEFEKIKAQHAGLAGAYEPPPIPAMEVPSFAADIAETMAGAREAERKAERDALSDIIARHTGAVEAAVVELHHASQEAATSAQATANSLRRLTWVLVVLTVVIAIAAVAALH